MTNRIEQTKNWIAGYIIQMNLCPFAERPYNQKRIQYLDFEEINDQVITQILHDFTKQEELVDTTFLIYKTDPSYLSYLDDFYLIEDLITEIGSFEGIKLVPFHPEYEHGFVEDQVEHFTNRSPFPTIQLLRADIVKKVANAETVTQILENNATTLQKIGIQSLKKTLDEFK